MRCSKCGTDNREGRKFCSKCGVTLARQCPRCGASNEPGDDFCGECGAAVAANAASAAASSPQAASTGPSILVASEQPDASTAIEGERKTVTALFADIKGSTELMRHLDPEEARAIIDPALRIMVDAVRRYDGYVVQSTGDGIFAVFGAPAAYEDHPQRTLYAALRMQGALREHAERLAAQGKPAPQARVGINTGEVVMRMVETGGRVEYTPVGHVANLAARMQSVAPAGGIVISEETRRLSEGYFELRGLGPTEVKGISEPINVYEVVGAGPLRGHFELATRRGLTKFVGREREVAEMKRALELARSGHGQIVAAVAEAGTGKSRLVYEFKAMLPGDCKLLEAYSVSHGKASAYLPVLELLYGYFGIADADDKAPRRGKIETRLSALDPALSDTLPLLYTLMGLHEGPDPLAQMDPQIKRRRMLDAIKRIILRESLNQLTVVVFEDLHWIDSETQALLDLLTDGIANARILLLVNYRPEYRHEWTNKSYYVQLRLDALGRESAEEMLSTLLGDGVELDPLKRMVIERTEGNPFFIEEMVQGLFDDGALIRNGEVKIVRPLSQLRLPLTVQGILASRIDRLSAGQKDLLQTLAVIGRESPLALIRQLASTADASLEQRLSDLQAGEFIYEQPAVGDVEYVFKHALTQEVAYDSILIERRKLIHARTGAAIEAAFAGRIDDHIEKLVNHYSRSGNARKTVRYTSLAAQQAFNRGAFPEAMLRVDAAFATLSIIPEDRKRDELELALQIVRGDAIFANPTQAAEPALLEAYSRARNLCRKVGTATQTIGVLRGLQRYYQVTAKPQLRVAREFAEEMLAVAERTGNQQLSLAVGVALSHCLWFLGDFALARRLLEDAAVSLDPSSRFLGDRDPDKMVGLYTLARVLWFLGFPTEAARRNEQAIAWFRSETFSPYPISLYGIVVPASTTILLRDWTRTMQLVDEIDTLASKHELPFFQDYAQKFRGAALIQSGQHEKGLALIDPFMRAADLKGIRASEYWHFLVPAAEGYGRCGRARYALQLVEDALSDSAASGRTVLDSEYQRAKGELLLVESVLDEAMAEESFREAIETARGQGAKMPELRATMSLARLLAKQDRRDEARTMLAEIYGWFTEGFDTADLKDAKALLDELNAYG